MPWFLLSLLFFSIQAIAIESACIPESSKSSSQLPNKSASLSGEEQIMDDYSITISGNANLYVDNLHLSADKIIINKIDNTLKIIDNIRLNDQRIKFSAKSIAIESLNDTASITLKDVDFVWLNTLINGHAKSAKGSKGKSIFNEITFSTCASKNHLWIIDSKKLILDHDKGFVVAYDATFKFKGIPVFYSPIYRWSLLGKSSGVLTPKFNSFSAGNNKQGLQIIQPYYFDIAPDRDLILSANILSNRGTGIKSHYRQLFTNADVDFKLDYLPNDKILTKKRWLLETKNNFKLSTNTELTLDINRVSDLSYFEDIEHRSFSERSLKSIVKIQRESLRNDIYLSGESYQIIQGDSDFISEIKLHINTRDTIFSDSFDTQFNITNFISNNPSQTNGTRLYNELSYTKNSYLSVNTIISEINTYFRYYNLSSKDSQSDAILNTNIDSQWHFSRQLDLFGNEMMQTLTPRVFYNYTQDKNQDDLPNIDSELIIQNYNTLFSNRVYTGFDRIQAANNITLGLSSAFYDDDNKQRFDMGIAQTFYAKAKNNPYDQNKSSSNFVVNFIANMSSQKFDMDLVYNDNTQELVEQHYSWFYQPTSSHKKLKTLNWSYHKIQDNDNETQEYGQINTGGVIGAGFELFAGVEYDIANKQTNKNHYGITFKNCCLFVELSSIKSFNNSNDSLDNLIGLKFDLLGF